MDHMAQAHSDIVNLAAFSAPVFIRIGRADDGASHHHTVPSVAGADHVEPVTNMGFLVVPYTPVIVESVFVEVIHGFIELRQLVIADVRVPSHDECLAEMLPDESIGSIKELVPVFVFHLVKKHLGFIQLLEATVSVHQFAKLTKKHHLACVSFHHADIATGTDEDILGVVNDSQRTELFIL